MNTDIKVELKDGKICIPFDTIFYQAYDLQADEWDQVQFINNMAWMPQIREEVLRILREQYSGPNYNTEYHEEREKLLKDMQLREVDYYARLIAARVEDTRRVDADYWRLYDWLREANVQVPDRFPQRGQIDFDYRRELEAVITEALNTKIEVGNDRP